MIRYIDLESRELRSLMTALPVVSELSKRGAAAVAVLKYQVQFVRNAAVIELSAANTELVKLAFKAPNDYDASTYVAGPFTAVKTGTGTATIYTFSVSLETAALDQLLATNLDDVTLDAEISWNVSVDVAGAEKGETLAFYWVVQNNIQR